MSEQMLIQVDESSSDEKALAVSSSGTFLPRLKLCQGGAKEVAKKLVASGGNWALISGKDDVEDLGSSFVVIVVAARAKALDTSDSDMIITNFEPDSDTFHAIEDKSKQKDSGAMFGPEFLVWLPDSEMFATVFLCSATARRQGGEFASRKGRAMEVSSEYIEGKSFSWYGPLSADYSGAVTNLPAPEDVANETRRFVEERSTATQLVTPEGTTPEAGSEERDR